MAVSVAKIDSGAASAKVEVCLQRKKGRREASCGRRMTLPRERRLCCFGGGEEDSVRPKDNFFTQSLVNMSTK